MKNPLRLLHDLLPVLALAAASAAPGALVPSQWQHRQDVAVAAPGLVRIELNDATFDAARSDGADLRILDPEGGEVASFQDPPADLKGAYILKPETFEYRIEHGSAIVTLRLPDQLDADAGPGSIELKTPHPHFLRAVRVERSDDKRTWRTTEEGVPLFRQWGAEKLSAPFDVHDGRWVRLRVSGPALPFTGATLISDRTAAQRRLPTGARVVRREEFAGETVFTVALDARNTRLSSLEIDTPEPLFMRRVTVSVRDVRDLVPAERVVGSGTIYRVAVDGAKPRARLELPLAYSPTTRELLVHVHNGDSPPLAVRGLRLYREPFGLTFHAATPGRYTILSGNPQAPAPRYDVAAFTGEFRPDQITTLQPGPLQDNPGYQPGASPTATQLPEVPVSGAPFDPDGWTHRKAVELAAPGVQELELDAAALAGARDDLGDLRLVRADRQIPYVLERTSLARAVDLEPVPSPDPKRPTVSIWRLDLPHDGMPLLRLALASDTPLFQRQFRLYERIVADDGRSYEQLLASGAWDRTPEPASPRTCVFQVEQRPSRGTLYLETDNGDNPPIALTSVRAELPVVRLVFLAAATEGLALIYGNERAPAPRYDLRLVATKLLTAARSPARLGEEESAPEGFARGALRHLQGGVAFWGALSLVVVVLLVTVARLLPKGGTPQ